MGEAMVLLWLSLKLFFLDKAKTVDIHNFVSKMDIT